VPDCYRCFASKPNTLVPRLAIASARCLGHSALKRPSCAAFRPVSNVNRPVSWSKAIIPRLHRGAYRTSHLRASTQVIGCHQSTTKFTVIWKPHIQSLTTSVKSLTSNATSRLSEHATNASWCFISLLLLLNLELSEFLAPNSIGAIVHLWQLCHISPKLINNPYSDPRAPTY
jgi:hypothetical protein